MARLSYDYTSYLPNPGGTIAPGRTSYIPPTAYPIGPDEIRDKTNENTQMPVLALPKGTLKPQSAPAAEAYTPDPANTRDTGPGAWTPANATPMQSPAQPAPQGGNPVVRQETDGSFWYADGTHVSSSGMIVYPNGDVGWTDPPQPVSVAWGTIPTGGYGGGVTSSTPGVPGQAQRGSTQQAPGTLPPGGWQNWFMGLTNGLAANSQSLESLAPQLAEYGVKLGPRNAMGIIDSIVLPDGSEWDVGGGFSGGNGNWQFNRIGGGGGVPGQGGGVPGRSWLDNYIQDLLSKGNTDYARLIQGEIAKIIATGGLDSDTLNNRLVNAREDLAQTQRSQTNNNKTALT